MSFFIKKINILLKKFSQKKNFVFILNFHIKLIDKYFFIF
jgi:hypothetical protein